MSTHHSLIRFGILGTGRIAHDFCLAFKSMLIQKPHLACKIHGVATRNNLEKSQQFSQLHEIPHAFDSYESMMKHSEIDIIYVATPTSEHYAHVKKCLEHDKSVLCEKTFTLNYEQGQELFEMARKRNLFLMEANWMPFFPLFQKMIQLVRDGTIGQVKLIEASLGFQNNHEMNKGLVDANLGGGALLACGIYPISLCCFVYDCFRPQTVQSVASFVNQVDETVSCQLAFSNNSQLANVVTSIGANLKSDATIYGSKGTIHLHPMCCCSLKMSVSLSNSQEVIYEEPLYNHVNGSNFNFPNSEGLGYEIEHVVECMKSGKIESEIMTHKVTLETLKILDLIRSQIGLKYPQENNQP
ncbi:hypothetical protein C9374_012636 [Naegleria lovaniensis]|uniref:D-xylose 1-dehydrogenase (NADP(+), D-xylono-1,5-lactone-forming) n=1 Tax=Naegleria lovaniensis TaxID=51637 RepID=A0AA88GXI2_NAELO|nr:uncharacterized protein C9374_012636 [Naegleria lovaniensis]KAG2392384.1 hypothetical protein C9374_012636 [Naegleria lovaniensis]